MGTSIKRKLDPRGETRKDIDRPFADESKLFAYKPVVLGADRHGTLVWEAAKGQPHENLKRYVTVSITPVRDDAVFDAWVVVSLGDRFVRRDIGSETVEAARVHPFVGKDGGLVGLVQRAFAAADHLSQADLTWSSAIDEGFTFATGE